MKKVILFVVPFILLSGFSHSQSKLSDALKKEVFSSKGEEKVLVWVFFKDKGAGKTEMLFAPEKVVSPRSLQRRAKVFGKNALIDYSDLPVNSEYISRLQMKGFQVKQKSRWFNAVSGFASSAEINEIASNSFVSRIDLVAIYKTEKKIETESESSLPLQPQKEVHAFDYGQSYTQLQQLNVPAVHDMGIKGQGLYIAVLDAGFNNLPHEVFSQMNIIAKWDFVNNDPDVGDGPDMGDGSHGTQTLSAIGGYKNGQLIGPAFGASFILAKTENDESETPVEEDNWIAGIEWADSIGADISSTSLGYIDFDSPYQDYTWQSMNGNTCRITIAADLAVKKGIVVVNSAGNEGDNATHNTLGAPADGDSVIAVGAVTSSGSRSYFSSVGPTVDGRTKPDVMAMGSGVRVASPSNPSGYTNSDGTSFSCPLAAGVAALVLSANPSLTPMQVRHALRSTASKSSNPDNKFGWGILNALEAVKFYMIKIVHTPLLDTENPGRIHRVQADFTSQIPLNNSRMYLYYSVNQAAYDSILLQPVLPSGRFEAIIPVSSGNVTVRYYIKAENSAGVRSYYPSHAPQEYIQFRVGPDVTAPTISHNALGPQSLYSWPVKVRARVTDNLSVKKVKVVYKHNNGAEGEFLLSRQAASDDYEAVFPIPVNQMATGDVISYKIAAEDSAAASNTALLPQSGYLSFTIVDIAIYSNQFNSDNGGLVSTNDWQWGVPTAPPSAYSAPKVWGTVLTGSYANGPRLSTLALPSFRVIDAQASFSFWHWYEIENKYDGGNVKISVNGGPLTLINPVVPYPGVVSTSFGNPIGGENAYMGTTTSWIKAEFSLSGKVQTGDNVSIVLCFGADDAITKRGWYIDDFACTGMGTAVPVELTSFTVKSSVEGTLLLWITATETNNYGFDVESSTDGRLFNKIGFVRGMGTVSEPHSYSFVVKDNFGGVVYYRLKQIDHNGAVNYSSIISTENKALPARYALHQNYPNPFNPATTLNFSVPEKSQVRLILFDILGRKISTLADGVFEAGDHSFRLDAGNLSSGLYLVRMESGDFSGIIKIMLAK